MSAIGASKAKEKREAEAEPVDRFIAAGICKVCGEPLKAKVTGFGAVGTKCLCKENAALSSVVAMGLIREGEGWTLVELELPEHVVLQHAGKKEGPHSADVAAAKLEEWLNRKAIGLR